MCYETILNGERFKFIALLLSSHSRKKDYEMLFFGNMSLHAELMIDKLNESYNDTWWLIGEISFKIWFWKVEITKYESGFFLECDDSNRAYYKSLARGLKII